MELYYVTTEGAEALAASTAETLVQLRGVTTTRAKIVAWGVSFNGTSSTDPPALVDLLYQTTDGTASGATEGAEDPDAAAATVTGFNSFSAEPTAGTILEQHYVHPQGGNLMREYPPGREPRLDNATSSRIGIRVTPGTITGSLSAVAWLCFEE